MINKNIVFIIILYALINTKILYCMIPRLCNKQIKLLPITELLKTKLCTIPNKNKSNITNSKDLAVVFDALETQLKKITEQISNLSQEVITKKDLNNNLKKQKDQKD